MSWSAPVLWRFGDRRYLHLRASVSLHPIHSDFLAFVLSKLSYPDMAMTGSETQEAPIERVSGTELPEPQVLSSPAALRLENVTKYFGTFKAVDDSSFELEPGTVCGFLGPNGAGKTTTLRMVLEIFRPSSGTITVLGRPSAFEVRRKIGYLPEEKGLYKKMKAWAAIAYFGTLKGMSRKAAKARAFELLERFGLKDFARKPTEALSKGMGQKVQMLASIVHDPELVILDEPFSGLVR